MTAAAITLTGARDQDRGVLITTRSPDIRNPDIRNPENVEIPCVRSPDIVGIVYVGIPYVRIPYVGIPCVLTESRLSDHIAALYLIIAFIYTIRCI